MIKKIITGNQAKDVSKEITFILGGLTGGGAERVAVHLMNTWIDKGRKIKLISMRGPEKDAYSIPQEVERISLGGEGASSNKLIGFAKNIQYIWTVRKAIKSTNSQLVLSFLTRANIYAVLACIGLDIHVIISERNDITRQTLNWPWSWLRKKLYKFADIVTANSMEALDNMKEYVPVSKLALVPNPVILPKENDTASPDKSKVLLNVARLTSQKAQYLLIEALAELKSKMKYKDWFLQILGEGEEREYLIQLAEKRNLMDQVELLGFVKNPSFNYQSAAIFILPSIYEGTPNALLEAMSYGLSCVVSDSLPGALELIEDGVTGLVFKSEDVNDLTRQLDRLIENPNLRVLLGKAARDRVKEFVPEKTIKIWEKLLI